MVTAFTRALSPSIRDCQLTFMERQAIDFQRASEQHGRYEAKLRSLGVYVVTLPPAPHLPDAVFVEDTAVVVDELAVIAMPAGESRRLEVHDTARALKSYRPLHFLSDSATLEGGDIILCGRRVFIGQSSRTNRQGAVQLRQILKFAGYDVRPVSVSKCLHLSTGASHIGRNTILANSKWVDTKAFTGHEVIAVPACEPWAANVLLIGGTILMPDCFPQTRDLLEERGFAIEVVDISEFQKAEAGITCMSLRLQTSS